MDVHEYGQRLSDDERKPNSHVAIMAVQKFFYKNRKRNLLLIEQKDE